MRILIEDLSVVFPYSLIFNEQESYMCLLKKALDGAGHAVLQMPTGTGKTICLLALLTAYLAQRTKYKKVIYCTRTVQEMEKTLKQLKKLLAKRHQEQPDAKRFFCLGLTAKKNLCIHEKVNDWRNANSIETQCRKRTAKWMSHDEEDQKCGFYQTFNVTNEPIDKKQQVYTMEDLREYGKKNNICPYFSAREAIKEADIIVFNYLYLLDPQISPDFIKKLAKSKDCIAVFDQAHNIDDVCIEVYTLNLNNQLLSSATQNVRQLSRKIQQTTSTTIVKYKKQLGTLIGSLKQKQKEQTLQKIVNQQNSIVSNFIPESISNSKLFISSIELILQFFRNKLKEQNIRYYDNMQMRKQIQVSTNLDFNFFKLAHQSFERLLMALQIAQVEELKGLTRVTLFCELIFTHSIGFKIVFQPHPMDGNIADPLLTLSCLDCALCLQPIWANFPSVILTSGTMSPISIYPKILGFVPLVIQSIAIQISRNPICPIILGKTSEQQPLSSEYVQRSQVKVALAYGNLLRGLNQIVPDGIICFFPSYMYMQHILKQWSTLKLIDRLTGSKQLFIQKKDSIQTQISLKNYRHACDIGRGAVFLAIARGKIAQGVDFQQHYGRCVVMMGFPVQNSHDPVLLQRIRFMVQQKQIKDRNEFFEFDTMRQCAQCLGRVMRTKTDYGIMILADQRFTKVSKYDKLPAWIKRCLASTHINASFQSVFQICSQFFRTMGKPFELHNKFFKTNSDYQ